MFLVQTHVACLGLLLRTLAGTMCTNDELAQVFTDVSSPKAKGTILQGRMCCMDTFALDNQQVPLHHHSLLQLSGCRMDFWEW